VAWSVNRGCGKSEGVAAARPGTGSPYRLRPRPDQIIRIPQREYLIPLLDFARDQYFWPSMVTLEPTTVSASPFANVT
jgi:hypothetical protein